MLKYAIICFIIPACSLQLSAQSKYARVDSIARNISANSWNARTVHRKLTSQLTSDEMKVRSFYVWITENIEYDVKLLKDKPAKNRLAQKPLKKRLRRTLRKRAAVCAGYSELFRELCRLSGIESEVIAGYYKNEVRHIGKRGRADHGWNKVRIDGAWRFVDVTWGSGGVYRNKFFKDYKEEYFLTDAARFYYNHYPAGQRYTSGLMELTLGEFFNLPVVHRGFFNWIRSLDQPSRIGKREVAAGDTLQISFVKAGPIGTFSVYNRDQPMTNYSMTRNGDRCLITIPFDEPGYYEPTVYLNTEPALTYQVYVKEEIREEPGVVGSS